MVCVAPLIERPLMVLVVAALMMPPSERLFTRVRLPALVRLFAFEKKLILPVVPVPNWSACLLLVPRTPVAVSVVAPVIPADKEAVGVPPATLVKANFALVVAVDPRRRSSVMLVGESALLFLWK